MTAKIGVCGWMSWMCMSVAGAVVVCSLSAPALAEVSVWELPAGKAADPAKREGWKAGAVGGKFDGGVAIENERVMVVVVPGASGAIFLGKGADASARTELRIGASNVAASAVTSVKLLDADSTDVSLRLVAGQAEADLALSTTKLHVEIKPVKNAQRLEMVSSGRYALVPNFVEEDKLFDALQNKVAVVPVNARLALLHLLDGGNAMLALMWKGASGAGMENTTNASPEAEMRKVDLASAERGQGRAFVSASVGFDGKPLYVGMLFGNGIWNSMDVRKVPGGKTTTAGWKRPFEAAWKVDMHVTDYDKQEVATFLKQAAELGLSKDRENDWKNAFMTMDEKRKDTDPLRIEASYFKPAGSDGALPPFSPAAVEGDDRVWPFVFKGSDTLVTVPAEWPCYPDPTKERLEPVQKKRAADGKELLWPIHVYGGFVIYPLDRMDKTPLDKFTVVDLMRQALGIGPCKLDWLDKCR